MDHDTDTNSLMNNVAQKALKQVRALARGNGADADQIQIQRVDADHIKCEAITHLELHSDIKTENKQGQHQIGQPMSDAATLEKTIQDNTAQAFKNNDVRKAMANTLLERNDKGFAIHGDYFDLPALTRTYSVQETCGGCNGQGRTACQRCHGNREEVCNQCRGIGLIPCTYCHATGQQQGVNNQKISCVHCSGRQQMTCPLCQRKGRIACRQCRGSGSIGCNTCKGAGAFTQITHLTYQMKTLFEIDRSTLPHPAVKAIETRGGRMVETQQIRLQAEQIKRDDGGLAIEYTLDFPYANMMISVNGKPYKMEIFGFKGKIVKLPAFLETLIGTQIALLEEASRGKGAVQSNIIKASKTRMIGEALAFTLSYPRKKAFIALKKKYPMGISNEGLKNLVQNAYLGIRKITQKARYTGYAIAGLFNMAVNIGYFMAGRDVIAPLLGQTGTMIVDFVLIPLGGFIGSLITKNIARRPLIKVLGHLIKNPKTLQLSVYQNYIISVGIFAVCLILLKVTGQNVPTWFNF